MVTHSQQEAMSMADKVIVMSDAMIQQIGTSREIHENPRNRFVADFIGNNNLFRGTIRSRSGSVVFVESDTQLYYVKIPEHIRQVRPGSEAYFSVRADLMHTGEQPNMANKVMGSYIATEFMGTLETDVFEIEPGHFVHVEQHRHLSDRVYQVGERETVCWAADSGVLLEATRRPEDLEVA
jgi:spermidine/putrescine transport system ATP-binding protein